MDVHFFADLCAKLSSFLDTNQYDPSRFEEISTLLLYVLRVLPAVQVVPQFNLHYRVTEREELQTLVFKLGALIFSHFEANCMIKHFLTVALRVFDVAHVLTGAWHIIFSLKTARNILWAFQKGHITSLDVTSFCGLLAQCVLQNKHDRVYDALSASKLTRIDFKHFVRQLESILQFFNTELVKNEQIGQYQHIIEQVSGAALFIRLGFEQEQAKTFDVLTAGFFALFNEVNAYCIHSLTNRRLELQDVFFAAYEDDGCDNLCDLKTYYKQYCCIADRDELADICFRKLNFTLEECLLRYLIASQFIALSAAYIDEIVRISVKQTHKCAYRHPVLPIQVDKLTKLALEDNAFLSDCFTRQKQVTRDSAYNLETLLFLQRFQHEKQLLRLLQASAPPKPTKYQFGALVAQCFQTGIYFAIQSTVAFSDLKMVFFLNKAMQALYIRSMLNITDSDSISRFSDVFGLKESEAEFTDNLAFLFLDNSSLKVVQRFFTLYLLQLSYQNVLEDHQKKLLSYDAKKFANLQIADLKIYLQGMGKLLLESRDDCPILPYICNIYQLCLFVLDDSELRKAFTANEIVLMALIFWALGVRRGAALQIIERYVDRMRASLIYQEICDLIAADPLERAAAAK